MPRKTVSFVQPNFQQGPRDFNNYYLPYSAGVVLAYAFDQDDIQRQWQIDQIIWRRDPLESTAQKLAQNDLVAFSTYVWNHRYNYALAKRVKELRPEVMIVFGGPEPAIHDPALFKHEPYMDVVIKLEGERIFHDVLLNHGQDLDGITGLILNKQG
jgi:hypothetical protein